jgi:hypothetical protein
MSIRTIILGGTAALLLAAAPAAGQSDGADPAWEHPVTPWGEPDLRGTWPLQHMTGTPLQRDPALGERRFFTDEELAQRAGLFASREDAAAREDEQNKLGMGHWVEFGENQRLTSLIVDPPNGRLPALTEEGERLRAEMRSGWMDIPFDWVTDFDNWDRCITRSLPASMLPSYYNNGVQIIQGPGVVVIRLEMIHEARVIYTDGRDPAPSGYKAWLGESRGHWDGDTLVIETTNFNGQGSITNIHTVQSPPFNNTPHSTEYTLTERITRTGPDTATYQATVEDPIVWTQPWTVEMPWQLDNEYELYEYACHEGNVMIPNYISASRASRGITDGDIGAEIRARLGGGAEIHDAVGGGDE